MRKIIFVFMALIIISLTSCCFFEHEHQHNKVKFINDEYHVLVCECGYGIINKHEMSPATCTEKSICNDCGYEIGELKSHEYTIKNHDAENHWLECSCGAKNDIEGHAGGVATCTSIAICAECNIEYGELKSHEYIIENHDAENHWLECSCGDKTTLESHNGGNATCTEQAICLICAASYGEILEHDYLIEKFDSESHWLACECEAFIVKENHEFGLGEITLDATDKETGIKSYGCLNCEYIKEEVIPMIDGYEVEHYPHLSNADVVYYEGNIYTYGGNASGRTNSIYCYNVNSDTLYKLHVKLKSESTSHRVVLVDDKVYIFGGLTNSGRLQTILVHDLKNQTLDELDIKIPFGINCFQVGYYENKIYLIAGSTSNGNSNKIYQFDVETKVFTELSVTIPTTVFKGAWCFIDKYAYVIGGTNGKRLTSIYRFDMETHEVTTMNGKLPYQISQSRAVYDGKGNIFIYGGTNESNQLVDDVFKYNILEDVCTLEDYSIPGVIANTCVANTGKGIYILGGDNAYIDIILKHDGNKIESIREAIAVD